MTAKVWNRRELLRTSTTALAGAALCGYGKSAYAAAQFTRPEPLEDDRVTLMTTTAAQAWQKGAIYKPTFQWEMLNLNITSSQTGSGKGPAMQGFGGCFNDLGWTSLEMLSQQDRESVLRELFHPTEGARFIYCRMPIGTNDYATEAYSYDETDGDFDLKHFSIDHDRRTLVPFIHAAQRYQPKLKLWASPWTPPSWMKRNHFYAEAKSFGGLKENGIRADQIGHEGEDMFLQEPRYFEAYANYFGRFLDAYRAEGITIGMVMPQNEFNSAQIFPSCTWTPEGLARFLKYLGPRMQRRNVEIFFGTLERGNPKLLQTVMSDASVAPFLKGVGVQWAGKNGVSTINREYPQLTIFQSEQECGDGKNSWSYTGYCWQLMKQYFRNGASGYMYWNISTLNGGLSTWGWPQNSLVSVDPETKTFKYNHDYYLLKHLTHFVEVGATMTEVSGTCDDALAFENPDGTVIVLVRNSEAHEQIVQVQIRDQSFSLELPPDSLNTLAIKAA